MRGLILKQKLHRLKIVAVGLERHPHGGQAPGVLQFRVERDRIALDGERGGVGKQVH